MHHASIRTANIHRAIAFYERLGFTVCERFTTGYTLACWMDGDDRVAGLTGRLELIEIPDPKPAPDAFHDEHYVGYYHLSFDLTDRVASLPEWLDALRSRFGRSVSPEDSSATEASDITDPDRSEPTLTVLLEPQQQQIGTGVYEVAFIADADGLPLELIRRLA
ncbi:MAG: VOC family protein [Oscillatoriales cyanobacterium]|nr:MAG: VOC family protein [Oscillatoriales cyanobacterium]